MRKILVAGIGGKVGKTIVSGILTEALQADYWKPIQSLTNGISDTERIKRLVTSDVTVFHQEAYHFHNDLAPFLAADELGKKIHWGRLKLPETDNTLIIEAVSGLMTPLNLKGEIAIDMAINWQAEVVLVVSDYDDVFNQTLLNLELLKSRKVQVLGIVFNGFTNPSLEDFIAKNFKFSVLGKVKHEHEFTPELVTQYARDYVFI